MTVPGVCTYLRRRRPGEPVRHATSRRRSPPPREIGSDLYTSFLVQKNRATPLAAGAALAVPMAFLPQHVSWNATVVGGPVPLDDPGPVTVSR